MLKYMKKLLYSDITIGLLSIGAILFVYWLYMCYSEPEIHYMYNGIKYHKSNIEMTEPIKIEIDGTYKRTLLGNRDEFKGKIKIEEQVFVLDYPLKFNKYKMAVFDDDLSSSRNGSFYGMIYISGMFKEMTIQIYYYKGNGVYSANRWMISAPCKNRKEAVEISHRLMGDLYR